MFKKAFGRKKSGKDDPDDQEKLIPNRKSSKAYGSVIELSSNSSDNLIEKIPESAVKYGLVSF